MNESNDVHSIVRALKVIEVLNQRTVTSVDRMHQITEIPKPTLVRLLNTLVGAGYVFHVSRRDGYALTEKILRLSAGYRYHDAIVDIARPLLEDFTRRQKWQVSLATRDIDAMRFRYNTRHLSPFSPDERFLNRRVRMLHSAVGRAYLAYCSEIERDVIMSCLPASDIALYMRAEDRSLDPLLESIREKRYATAQRPATDHVRSFAIPVLSQDTAAAVASIVMFYYASAMTETQAASKFLDELYEIARNISMHLIELNEDDADPMALRGE